MPEILVNGRWPLHVPDHRVGHWQRNPTWEGPRLASMAANIKPGMVVWDLGAELGDISALLASWVGKRTIDDGLGHPGIATGGVVLVEPGAHYWPTIRETFRLNGLPDPLYTWHGFAADRDENWMPVTPGERVGWPAAAFNEMTGLEAFGNVKGTRQPVITLDTLAALSGRPPDAITCDVEGAEILVVRGAQRVLAEHPPLVWVSVHAEAMFHDHHVYQAEFFSEFHKHGYEKQFLDFDHEAHWFFYPGERRAEVALP